MMTLLLDVGNTQIYAGLFNAEKKMVLSFRRNSKNGASSDETGLFLRAAIKENGFDPKEVKQIALCSVVPDVIYSLRGACQKYFGIQPFILQAGVKTGLKIKYRNPLEVGADRIANSISATHLFPQQNIIVVDLGTATTFCAISDEKDYLGGSIVAGLRLCMEALESQTSKLPSVEIQSMSDPLGKSTVESIQSGLYFGHLGTIKEIINQLSNQVFNGKKPIVIGTGGFAHLFEKEKVFDVIIPDLVLQGLWEALKLNEGKNS